MNEINERIKKILEDEYGCNITNKNYPENYLTDFGLDSLDHVELSMMLEEIYNIELSDDEMCGKTVNELAKIIEKKRKG